MPATSDRRCRRWIRAHFRRRPLLPFLLAATAALNVAALLRVSQDLALPIAIAQCGLLGLWAGRLRRGWPARLVAAPLAVLASAFFSSTTVAEPILEVFAVLGVYTALVAAISAGAQVAARLTQRRFGEVRFTIGGMLLGLTITACLVALFKFAIFQVDHPIDLAIGFGSLGLLPLLAGAVTSRVNDPLPAAAGIFLAALFAVICFYLGVGSGPSGEWIPRIFCQGLIIGVWLLGVRSRGRRRPTRQNQPENEQADPPDSAAEEPPVGSEPDELEPAEPKPGSLDLKA